MTGQQLKNSILQMAVQGKLVPQDPNDEPASVLLERIRKEKEQLIKEGKIKKEKNPSYIFRGADNLPYEKVGKNEPVCIADEVPFDIPDSWEWVRVSSLGSIVRGSGIKRTEIVESGKPCVRYGELYTTYHTSFNQAVSFVSEELFERCKHFSYGDILMTLTGENKPDIAKAVAYLGNDLIAAGGDLAYWTAHGMNPLYLTYLMSSPYVVGRKISLATGDIIVHISGDKLGTVLIPIPPLTEQQRIVDKILEAEVKLAEYTGKENLLNVLQKNFPDALKKSILQEAIQGKLVPQDPTDEPASVLLERIRAEKEQLIKAGKIKRDKHESVIFRRDNSHYEKRGSKEENINDIIPFELPDSWKWIRLSAILTSTDAGKSPQCENRPRTIGEWGVIKTTAIQDGYFLAEENKVLPLDFNLQESMVVHHGDLLITRAGPRNRTGVICVVDGEPGNLILSDKTVRLSYLRNFVNPHYVMTALSSPAMQYFVVDAMTGMAASQVNISQEKMKTFLLPLPPLNEQQRIVDEVSKIFGRIDKLNF